jgi:hypothetical protein
LCYLAGLGSFVLANFGYQINKVKEGIDFNEKHYAYWIVFGCCFIGKRSDRDLHCVR